MRILVTGAAGQLGTDVVAACTAAGDEVFAFDRPGLDVSDRAAVLGAVTSLRPDAVVNCAAWTAVDACEADPELALAMNGIALRWMAEACARADAHLVQVSTDYVFDGEMDRPYHEWDEPGPQSIYGVTKLIGERESLAIGPRATVVRTSWVCGVNGSNMVKTIMRLAGQHDELAFVADQIGHPTFTQDLAPVLRRVALDRLPGVVHATNQGAVTWYEFAREVVGAMGKDPDMVRPIATTDLQPPRPAPRPANSVLDNAVLRLAGFPELRDHREPLAETVAALLNA
jgi:dTDP-4-dehydrorhamnose reductase